VLRLLYDRKCSFILTGKNADIHEQKAGQVDIFCWYIWWVLDTEVVEGSTVCQLYGSSGSKGMGCFVQRWLKFFYNDLAEEPFYSYQAMWCNMSIKPHYLKFHLDKFPENLGDFSEEQGKRFRQDIKVMKECSQGHWGMLMMATNAGLWRGTIQVQSIPGNLWSGSSSFPRIADLVQFIVLFVVKCCDVVLCTGMHLRHFPADSVMKQVYRCSICSYHILIT